MDSISWSSAVGASDPPKKCAYNLCFQTEALKRCTACKEFFYCGPEHQKRHWRAHREACKLIVGAPSPEERVSIVKVIKGTYNPAPFRHPTLGTGTTPMVRPARFTENVFIEVQVPQGLFAQKVDLLNAVFAQEEKIGRFYTKGASPGSLVQEMIRTGKRVALCENICLVYNSIDEGEVSGKLITVVPFSTRMEATAFQAFLLYLISLGAQHLPMSSVRRELETHASRHG